MEKEREITFEGQKENEQVLEIGRKHPFVLSKLGGVILIIALIITGLYMKLGMSQIPSTLTLIFLAVGGFFMLRAWFCYSHSIYILTNERLIGMEQKGFFSRKASEASLDKIVSISFETKGFVSTLLNFGDLIIQTAASTDSSGKILLTQIPDPFDLQQKIARAASEHAGTKVEIELAKDKR